MINLGNTLIKNIYLGDKKVKAVYQGDKKVFPATPRYYNGWEHDMPEPDWATLATTIPVGSQIWRSMDGEFYHTNGYSGATVYKRRNDLSLVGSFAVPVRSNRSMPYLLANFKNREYDVLVMPAYNEANTPAFIRLDTFTRFTEMEVAIPAGTFVDGQGTISSALPAYTWGMYYAGGSIFSDKGSLATIGDIYGIDTVNFILKPSLFCNKYNINELPLKICQMAANGTYLAVTTINNTIDVFNINTLKENGWDYASAYLFSMPTQIAIGNTGYDAFYIYENKAILVGFTGGVRVFNLDNAGAVVYSATLSGGGNGGALFWRNKIFRTNNRVVTTLPI